MIHRILLRVRGALDALYARILNTTEEEAFCCPCCGFAPCDCDDH